MLAQIKRLYFRFIMPPLHNTLMLNFRARLSRREYIIFWCSMVVSYILVALVAYRAISFMRWIFRALLDVKYPKWGIGHLEWFFIFGFMLFVAMCIVPFFVTTANRLRDSGIRIYTLIPLLILLWLWGANVFQFGILPSANAPLFYNIISISLFVYFAITSAFACLLPTKPTKR